MSYFDTLFYKRALEFESQRHRDYSGATCSVEDIKQKSLAQLWVRPTSGPSTWMFQRNFRFSPKIDSLRLLNFKRAHIFKNAIFLIKSINTFFYQCLIQTRKKTLFLSIIQNSLKYSERFKTQESKMLTFYWTFSRPTTR